MKVQDSARDLRLRSAIARWRKARRLFQETPSMANAHKIEQADVRVREARRRALIVVSTPDPDPGTLLARLMEQEAHPWTFS